MYMLSLSIGERVEQFLNNVYLMKFSRFYDDMDNI